MCYTVFALANFFFPLFKIWIPFNINLEDKRSVLGQYVIPMNIRILAEVHNHAKPCFKIVNPCVTLCLENHVSEPKDLPYQHGWKHVAACFMHVHAGGQALGQ